MKIKSIKKIKSDKPIKFYDITVDDYHNFSIGDSQVITHNSSVTGSLNKLARPFGNAMQILDGYGFFGSEVSPDPAAARYTSVRINSVANSILNQYKHLTTREPEGPYDPFWMEVPLGLTTSIVGIAVGYKTTVLPRKLEHIKEYLAGTRKAVKPYFKGFNGTVAKYNKLDHAWLMSSIITVEDKRVQINEIPPILKYKTVLKKLDYLILKFEGKVRIVNNSNTKVDIGIIYTGNSQEQFDELVTYIKKTFSIVVTEAPVFIKDDQVLVYDSVEQYLDDYRWQLLRLKYFHIEWERNKLKNDLDFNEAKKLFIEFILTKKQSNDDITEFLKQFHKDLRPRLEAMTARKFSKDELAFVKTEIARHIKELKAKITEFNSIKKEFESTPDPTIERGVGSKKTIIDLFDTDDVEEVDGMLIWGGEDVFEEEQLDGEDDE